MIYKGLLVLRLLTTRSFKVPLFNEVEKCKEWLWRLKIISQTSAVYISNKTFILPYIDVNKPKY